MVSPGEVNESILLSIGSGEVTPQKVYLKVDSDKQGYIEYPDGTYQATVAGVIDTTWNHSAGAIRLIVPKTSALFEVTKIGAYNAGFFGASITSRLAAKYEIGGVEIKNLNLPLAIEVRVETRVLQSILIPNARKIRLSNCPNLPISNLYKIIDDMYQLHLDGVNLTGGVLNLGGTTKAINTHASSAIHGMVYFNLLIALDFAGVTITLKTI